MAMIAIIFSIAVPALAEDISSTRIVDDATGLDAIVVSIPPEQNRGFAVIDVPSRSDGDNIRRHWTADCVVMINGGFFNPDFTPTGYCRIDGQVLGRAVAKKLSGFVALDKAGALSLLGRGDDFAPYPTVVQAGPYVIDPGGKVGIRSSDGMRAWRTLIGRTKDGQIRIVVAKPITLYDLALAVKKAMPDIERLLNLDGGPSTAFKTATDEILNRWPVRNYIVKWKPVNP
jgi:uncharacterized protein YigE (DUF2233 family)